MSITPSLNPPFNPQILEGLAVEASCKSSSFMVRSRFHLNLQSILPLSVVAEKEVGGEMLRTLSDPHSPVERPVQGESMQTDRSFSDSMFKHKQSIQSPRCKNYRLLLSKKTESFVCKPACIQEPINGMNLKESLPMLSSMSKVSSKFNAVVAVQQMIHAVHRPQGLIYLTSVLDTYEFMEKDKKVERRWQQVLGEMFQHPECFTLTHSFISRNIADCTQFFNMILLQKKLLDISVLSIIFTMYTAADLAQEKVDTMFREKNLSSCIYKVYGGMALEPFLNRLKQCCLKFLQKHKPPYHFYATLPEIENSISHTGKLFDKSALLEQLQKLDEVIEKNVIFAQAFIVNILNQLYQMPIDEPFRSLLTRRREQIYQKINELKEDSKGARLQSEIVLGESLFLRIINPMLVGLATSGETDLSDQSRFALRLLSKTIQSLANQMCVPNDQLYNPMLMGIHDDFRGIHQTFINKYFPLEVSI